MVNPVRWVRSHGREGVLRLVKHPYYWLRYYPDRRRYRRILAPVIAENEAFDRLHGTDTAAQASLVALDVPSDSWTHGSKYGAISETRFRECMSRVEVSDYSGYTFVDLGSGKGKVLLLAAALPFRAIVGVEFAPDLVSIAETNTRTYLDRNPDLASRNISSVVGDAGAYEFPATPLVIFLFNPFDDTIMERVADSLEQSRAAQPRDIWIVYANQFFADVFRRRAAFREVAVWSNNAVFQMR